MKSYYRIAGIILFSIFITIFVSPVIASVVTFPLYKIMSRVVLTVTFFLFYYYRDRFGILNVRSLGFNSNKRWWLFLILGFALGLFSMAIISAMMLHTSIRFVIPSVLSLNWLMHLTGYLLIGFTVAVIEECFFRGFILQGLLKDSGILLSLFITNILYSIVHFLKPAVSNNIERLDLFASIKTFPLFFNPLFTDFHEIWPSIVGLFLVGVALSMAYISARELSLPIGLHAGWIVGIKSLSLGTDVTLKGSLWLNGNVTGHPFTWFIIFIFIVLLSMARYGFKRLDKRP